MKYCEAGAISAAALFLYFVVVPSATTACAAASRATGTRYGLHDT
jgi:hypothetical protein